MTETSQATATTNAPQPPIVFPVGHYTGMLYPGVGAPLKYHSVRIGRLTITMPTEQAFGVWAAAHRPVELAEQRWTREAVLETAARLQITDREQIMEEYFEDGILVEVVPGTPDTVGFAQAHRVVPLMIGLGNTPADPLKNGVGLFGLAPLVNVPTLVYDVWQWGSAGASLWDICVAYAEAGDNVQLSDVRERDPEYVLATFLETLPTLIGVNAAYIDEALNSDLAYAPPPPPSPGGSPAPGTGAPAGYPPDFPFIPGGNLIEVSRDDPTHPSFHFEYAQDPDSLARRLREEVRSAGWNIEEDVIPGMRGHRWVSIKGNNSVYVTCRPGFKGPGTILLITDTSGLPQR